MQKLLSNHYIGNSEEFTSSYHIFSYREGIQSLNSSLIFSRLGHTYPYKETFSFSPVHIN
jgi:hypothetical protein